jgi:hypothetical protein
MLLLPLDGAAAYRCDNHRILSGGFSRWRKRRPKLTRYKSVLYCALSHPI